MFLRKIGNFATKTAVFLVRRRNVVQLGGVPASGGSFSNAEFTSRFKTAIIFVKGRKSNDFCTGPRRGRGSKSPRTPGGPAGVPLGGPGGTARGPPATKAQFEGAYFL